MPYADPKSPEARAKAAARRQAWRERRRAAGEPTHPERSRRREKGLPARPERHAKPWLFIDTEGANDPEGRYGDPGRQWTFLICAASDDGFERSLYRGRPLTSRELIDFIISLPRSHKLGGFFFGYDLCQIFWQLPEATLKRMYGVGEEQLPVRWEKWVIRLFHTQARFICPLEPQADHPDDVQNMRGLSRTVWDLGKFYQCRLTTAIDNWQVAEPDEQKFIEKMKGERSDFDLAYWRRNHRELIAYSLLENRLGSRLQNRFDQTCTDLGYPLTSWYGAGSMAKSMMRSHLIDRHLEARAPMRRHVRPADDLPSHLPHTYFGGRFEIQAPGEYKPVHEYDLRSAYPASYRDLPCLEHGAWKLRRGVPSRREIGPHDLLTVDWRIPRTHRWGPFPHRDRDGSISYPASGSDHPVWGVELISALSMWTCRTGPVRSAGIYPRRWWQYVAGCDCRPFGWIDDVYRARVELGKDTRGYPLKLGMNAIYGSLASVLGAEFDKRRGVLAGWSEPRWASQITAWTRARLLDGLAAAGGPRSDRVIMFATDALYTTGQIEGLDLTDRLGGWEHKAFPRGGLLIQPGLYHLKGQDVVSKLKGRGISFSDMQAQIELFYSSWRADGAGGSVHLHLSPRYMGLRLMLNRGDLAGAWRWRELEREIRFDPSAKREKRRGGWWPRHEDGYRGREPHPGLWELICGEVADLDSVSQEQQEELWLGESQPEGPMAI